MSANDLNQHGLVAAADINEQRQTTPPLRREAESVRDEELIGVAEAVEPLLIPPTQPQEAQEELEEPEDREVSRDLW